MHSFDLERAKMHNFNFKSKIQKIFFWGGELRTHSLEEGIVASNLIIIVIVVPVLIFSYRFIIIQYGILQVT